MPRVEGGLHGLKADPPARADDQDCRHCADAPERPPPLTLMCDDTVAITVLMHRQERRGFDRGDAVLDHLLHLLKGAYLDLAHALARDAELSGKVLENDRLVG